ncbi:Regulator of G-protein signaling [Carpediemonas membranifera]|uniref:Regulator of G-protein signaling n=1 Tax=Carpediemonas membranifera TaxID=201153 RepID=A0A8J6BU39_9EUKA|nr:Regulator of G-protein signaling [Carpediemonas membranifera]|eukprot:KAG9389946.1 Regulator of G-protein signaling [Carpediemonas membranifera]
MSVATIAMTVYLMMLNILFTSAYTIGFLTSTVIAGIVLVSTPLSVRGVCTVTLYMSMYGLVCRAFVFDVLVDSFFRLIYSSSEIFQKEHPIGIFKTSVGELFSQMIGYVAYTATMCYAVYSYVLKPLVSLSAQRLVVAIIFIVASVVYVPIMLIHFIFCTCYFFGLLPLTASQFVVAKNIIYLSTFVPTTSVYLVVAALSFSMLMFHRVRTRARLSPPVFTVLLVLIGNRLFHLLENICRYIMPDTIYYVFYNFVVVPFSIVYIILLYTIIPVMFIIVPGRVKRCVPQAVASSPRCRRYLRSFMKRQYCEENFDFLTVTAKFRAQASNMPSSQDRKLLAKSISAQEIYDAFISDFGDFQVNLRQDTCLTILHRIKSDDISADLFEQAEKDVWAIINGDVYPRFLSSDEYGHMELMLRHGGAIKAVSVIGAGFILARQGIKERLIKYGVIKDHGSVDESWVHPFMRPDAFKFDRDAHKNVEMMENPLAQAYPAVGGGMPGPLSSI